MPLVIDFIPRCELGCAKGLEEESELGLGPSSPAPAVTSKPGSARGRRLVAVAQAARSKPQQLLTRSLLFTQVQL